MSVISYAQRFEDLYLAQCFEGRAEGFYIDVGAGHPVHDNASYYFYLRGWRGITVEPNPHLALLARAVRPRDAQYEGLIAAEAGIRDFHLVHDFHGLSTAVAEHAAKALSEFDKSSEMLRVPAVTLAELCERHDVTAIDFLKVDVEGLEGDVLRGNNWERFRPKVVVVEALAAYTLAPAWPEWEPLLNAKGYRYAWFDSLNRYYVAEEASELRPLLEASPLSLDDCAVMFRNIPAAVGSEAHPDHELAQRVADGVMRRLPLLDKQALLDWITADIAPAELGRPATAQDLQSAWTRLFGASPMERKLETHVLAATGTVRDLYGALIDTDRFRAALGRISASYEW
jgi:FkbM family methyltransferase